MYVLDCVCVLCVLAPAPVLVVGGVLECSPACACACVCVNRSREAACMCIYMCVGVLCGSCVHRMNFLCVLVYATLNTCGNNATDEKLKKRRV